MENFIIILSFLFIGMALKRIPAFPFETGNVLNLFVIYISLPALILLKVPELVLSKALIAPALMPWVLLLLSCALILMLSKIFRWSRPTTGCFLMVIPLGNTAFLGLPMIKAFFGEVGIPYALIYDQIGTFIAFATYGSIIIAIYGAEQNRPTIKSTIKKILLLPPFMALVIAFALKSFTYPQAAVKLLEILAATLVPLVMIAVGFQLKLKLSRKVTKQMCIGLALKLIIMPATALILFKIAGFEGMAARVSIFQAGMPPMISAGALAILADLAPDLAAAMVGIGMIISFATLPLLYQVI